MKVHYNMPGSPSAYRWVVLFACSLAFLVSFVDRLAWAAVSTSVGADLGLPVSALGVFASAFYAGYVASNFVGGIAADRFGGRITLSASMMLLGIMTLLFGFTGSIRFGLVVQAAMGFAAGADYSACIKLIVQWFDRGSRGRAMGIFLVGSSLGVVCTNALVPTLAESIGWTGVYQLLGTVTIAVAIFAYVILRDGIAEEISPTRPKTSIWPLLRSRNMLLLTAAGFGGLWGTWGFAFWANALMVRGHGLTPVEAGYVMSLAGIAAIIAKPLVGLLSDRLGGRSKWLAFGAFLSFSGLLLVFGSLETARALALTAPFLGVAAFIYSPVMALLVAEAAGREQAGAATGISASIWQLGSVIVPLVVGLLYSYSGSFMVAFATLAFGPFMASICMIFVKVDFAPARRAPRKG